jgi:hypothetical protein
MIERTVSELINNYQLSIHKHYLLRTDGICLYSNIDHRGNESTIALMAGMWQASEALGEFAKLQNDEGRICYENSSSGLIIHKLNNNENILYAIQYNNVLNPGLLKMKLKQLVLNLDETTVTLQQEIPVVDKKSEFLFSDISDAEIDRIFNF